ATEQIDSADHSHDGHRPDDHPDAAGRLADLVDLAPDLSQLGLDVGARHLAVPLDGRSHEASSLPLGRLLLQPAIAAPARTRETTSMITYGNHDQWPRMWGPVSVCRARRAASRSNTRPRPR